MGAAAALRAPEKLTRAQRELGAGRMMRSAVGCAVFSALAVLGDGVFLCLGGASGREPACLPLLLAAALVAALAAWKSRGAYWSIAEVNAS